MNEVRSALPSCLRAEYKRALYTRCALCSSNLACVPESPSPSLPSMLPSKYFSSLCSLLPPLLVCDCAVSLETQESTMRSKFKCALSCFVCYILVVHPFAIVVVALNTPVVGANLKLRGKNSRVRKQTKDANERIAFSKPIQVNPFIHFS